MLNPTATSLFIQFPNLPRDNGSAIHTFYIALTANDYEKKTESIKIPLSNLVLNEEHIYGYTIGDLRADMEYIAKFACENGVGIGLWSPNSEVVSTMPPNEPDSPPNFFIEKYSCEYVSLKWNIPFDGGASILGYKLLVMTESNENHQYYIEVGDRTQKTLYNIIPGMKYRFGIVAYNCMGDSQLSSLTEWTLIPLKLEFMINSILNSTTSK